MFKVRLVVDAEIYAGFPHNYDEEIIDFVKERMDHPFFVVAKNVRVEYEGNKTTLTELNDKLFSTKLNVEWDGKRYKLFDNSGLDLGPFVVMGSTDLADVIDYLKKANII